MTVASGLPGDEFEALPPPPQALKTRTAKQQVKRAINEDLANGYLQNERVFMALLFSRSNDYFIVGPMKDQAQKMKYPATTTGFGSALKFMAALMGSLALIFASNVAHAEWQKVLTYDTGTVYIDTANIKKTGYVRSFWSLLDYKAPQKAQRGAYFVSTRTHMEMDCRKSMVHILQFSMHSGPMLTGEIIDSQGVMREWVTIPPDTPLVPLFNFVCK